MRNKHAGDSANMPFSHQNGQVHLRESLARTLLANLHARSARCVLNGNSDARLSRASTYIDGGGSLTSTLLRYSSIIEICIWMLQSVRCHRGSSSTRLLRRLRPVNSAQVEVRTLQELRAPGGTGEQRPIESDAARETHRVS